MPTPPPAGNRGHLRQARQSTRPAPLLPSAGPAAPPRPSGLLAARLTVRAAGSAGRQAEQGQPARRRPLRVSSAAGRHVTAAFPAALATRRARQQRGSRRCSAPQRRGGPIAKGGKRGGGLVPNEPKLGSASRRTSKKPEPNTLAAETRTFIFVSGMSGT